MSPRLTPTCSEGMTLRGDDSRLRANSTHYIPHAASDITA